MNASDARKTEVPGPEPTPPAAKASSGPESSSSVPGPRRRQLVAREGESLIRCISCGGFLGKVMAKEDTYRHLKMFDDVVSLISSNYVEDANVDNVMHGAMHGLADSLDPDSAYLSSDQVKQVESRATPPTASARRMVNAEISAARFQPSARPSTAMVAMHGM